MMIIDNKFELEDLVYLITDEDQLQRIVTEIKVQPGGLIYQLGCGASYTDHYEFEISDTIKIFV